MFAGKKSAQIREILISESAWEEMTCLFAPSLVILITGVIPGISAIKLRVTMINKQAFKTAQLFVSLGYWSIAMLYLKKAYGK